MGMRLIWCSRMARSHFSTFSASRHVTGFALMNFSIEVDLGSKPCATTEQQISRLVIIPTSLRDCESMTTGMEPTLRSHMSLATCCAVSLGKQQVGFALITSLIFTEKSPSLDLYALTYFDFVDNLPVAGIRVGDSHGEIVLSPRINGPG